MKNMWYCRTGKEQFVIKLKVGIPSDSAFPFLDLYLTKLIYLYTRKCTRMSVYQSAVE